jgi:hypothetical protein
MSMLFQSKRTIMAALVAALSLGCGAWATTAQARGGGGGGGGHFGGGGAHFGGGGMHFAGGGNFGGGFGRVGTFGGLHTGATRLGGARFAGRPYSGWSDYGWDEPFYDSPYEGYDWGPSGTAGVASAAVLGGVTTPEDSTAYCSAHYRSYDPASGTFLGYDGLRHACG